MRAEKNQLVKDIQGLIELGPHMFLVRYKGLDSAGFNELRGALHAVGAECHVVPNRLLKRAAQAASVECLEDLAIAGDHALVAGGDDVVAVAKVLKAIQKDHKELAMDYGVLDGLLLDASQVLQLADLPPKEVLQAQLLGLLEAPAGQFVRVLNAKLASVVYVLNAYMSKKEQAA